MIDHVSLTAWHLDHAWQEDIDMRDNMHNNGWLGDYECARCGALVPSIHVLTDDTGDYLYLCDDCIGDDDDDQHAANTDDE